MLSRLVSQNNTNCKYEGEQYFANSAPYIGYRSSKGVQIKTLNKKISEYQIVDEGGIKQFGFLTRNIAGVRMAILNGKKVLRIFSVRHNKQRIEVSQEGELENVHTYVPHSEGLVFLSQDHLLKFLPLGERIEKEKTVIVDKCIPNTQLLPHKGSSIFTLQPHQPTPLYVQYPAPNPQVKKIILSYDPIYTPHAFYKDRLLLHSLPVQNNSTELQIYDIEWEKIVGKITYSGKTKHIEINDNVLLVVSQNDNVDHYLFFLLKDNLLEEGNIITHHCVYEKGKGNCFWFGNWKKTDAELLNAGKDLEFMAEKPEKISEQTSSILYVMPKNKQRVQMLRIHHTKLIQSTFTEEKLAKTLQSKHKTNHHHSHPPPIHNHSLQIQKQRVISSVQHRKGEKHIQQIQKRFIEHVVQIKMKVFLDKLELLEKRIITLEDSIRIIYNKMEESLKNINREEIRKNVQNLFEQVTPQFENYFSEVFKQISGVLDQGVTYYNRKLSKEAEVHKDALTQLVNMTFDATQEAIELGRQEARYSEKTHQSIEKLVDMRKRWESERKKNEQGDFYHQRRRGEVENRGKISIPGNLHQPSKPPNKEKQSLQ